MSACIESPVPKLFFAQLDALNDCLVIENLEKVTRSLYSKTTLNVLVFCELQQQATVINNNFPVKCLHHSAVSIKNSAQLAGQFSK
jgi:hypothetical protein